VPGAAVLNPVGNATQTFTGSIAAPSFIGSLIGNVAGNVTGNVTGNSSTATALAANGANCADPQVPIGVDASGVAEGCVPAWLDRPGLRFAHRFSGADNSVKVNNCIAQVIADGGGVCDAAGLPGNGTLSQEIDVGNSSSVPVALRLPNYGTWTNSTLADGTSCVVRIFNKSAIVGAGSGQGISFEFQAASGTNLQGVFCISDVTSNTAYIQASNFGIRAAAGAVISVAVADIRALRDISYLSNLRSTSFVSGKNWYFHNDCCSAMVIAINGECNSTTGCVPLTVGDGVGIEVVHGINFYSLSMVHPGAGSNNVVWNQRNNQTHSNHVFGLYMEGPASGVDTTTPALAIINPTGAPLGEDTFSGVRYGVEFVGGTRYAVDIAAASKVSLYDIDSVTGNFVNDQHPSGGAYGGATANSSMPMYVSAANRSSGIGPTFNSGLAVKNGLTIDKGTLLNPNSTGTPSRMLYDYKDSGGIGSFNGWEIFIDSDADSATRKWELRAWLAGALQSGVFKVGNDGKIELNTIASLTASPSGSGWIRAAKTDAFNFRNNANSADVNGVSLDASDRVALGGAAGITAQAIPIPGPIGGTTPSAITGTTVTGNTSVTTPAFVSSAANPAAAGLLRMANADTVNIRNAANSADVAAVGLDSSNRVVLGGSAGISIQTGLEVNANSTGSASRMTFDFKDSGAAGSFAGWEHFLDSDADSSTRKYEFRPWIAGVLQSGVFKIGNDGKVEATASYNAPAFISATANPASTGNHRLAKTDAINFRNNANGADVNGISLNASDQVQCGGSAGCVDSNSNKFSTIIASGTSAMGTSAISATSCATVVTTAATNTATTDSIEWAFNAAPGTGYTSGVHVLAYPTSGNVNFLVCNPTAGSLTMAKGKYISVGQIPKLQTLYSQYAATQFSFDRSSMRSRDGTGARKRLRLGEPAARPPRSNPSSSSPGAKPQS
jgi:hypothetical protein